MVTTPTTNSVPAKTSLFEFMDKFNKSQILKLTLIVILLVFAPLLSTPLRSTYLYLALNLLIISLAAEAGLLSFFSKAAHDKKAAVMVAPIPKAPLLDVPPNKEEPSVDTSNECAQKNKNLVEKSLFASVLKVQEMIKKCPSKPSLFFIGGGESEAEELEYDDYVDDDIGDDEDEGGVRSGLELFNKSETFIGNFYKQLKMQKEDSWKRIHGFYHKDS